MARNAAPDVQPTSILAAAEANDSRAMYVAARNVVAADLDNPDTPPRDRAALVLKLIALDKEIRALDAAEAERQASERAAEKKAHKAALPKTTRTTASGFNLAAL